MKTLFVLCLMLTGCLVAPNEEGLFDPGGAFSPCEPNTPNTYECPQEDAGTDCMALVACCDGPVGAPTSVPSVTCVPR